MIFILKSIYYLISLERESTGLGLFLVSLTRIFRLLFI